MHNSYFPELSEHDLVHLQQPAVSAVRIAQNMQNVFNVIYYSAILHVCMYVYMRVSFFFLSQIKSTARAPKINAKRVQSE